MSTSPSPNNLRNYAKIKSARCAWRFSRNLAAGGLHHLGMGSLLDIAPSLGGQSGVRRMQSGTLTRKHLKNMGFGH
jgi:hypothetical protein